MTVWVIFTLQDYTTGTLGFEVTQTEYNAMTDDEFVAAVEKALKEIDAPSLLSGFRITHVTDSGGAK